MNIKSATPVCDLVLLTAKSINSLCALAQLRGDSGDVKDSNIPHGPTAACCVLQRKGQFQSVSERGNVHPNPPEQAVLSTGQEEQPLTAV